jgi:hypothetical protein
MDQKKDWKVLKACGGGSGSISMFGTPNGEKREERRRATFRAKKYRARAAENLSLADCAVIQEVRDRHQQVAQYYLRLAEKEEQASPKR